MRANQDVEAIHTRMREWTAAVKAKDVDGILSLVTDDVVFLPPGSAPIRGKAALVSRYRSVFERFDLDQQSALEEIQILGDWAFAWGTDALTTTPVGGGESTTSKGHGMSLLRRQRDGSWKFARGINNMKRGS